MIYLENSKFFIMLLLFVVLGVFLGVIITTFADSNNKEDFSQINKLNISDDLQSTPLLLENSITISGDKQNNESYDKQKSTSSISEVTQKIPKNIKAVYLTGWSAGTASKRKTVIENLNKYGFNAVVIDIKDEAGHISYKSNNQTALDISASKNMISDINAVLSDFHNANIYVIGRIVTFKDPTYAKNITDNAYKTSDGSLWKDYSGNSWPNPYNVTSWDYPISLAKEAAALGFDEIQFDYIRFPSSEGKTKDISYGFESETKTKSEIINEFLRQAMNELNNYDVFVSADVFGITTKKRGDFEHIGQDFYEIAKIVDVICPMVYPSHYGPGEYGVAAPDTKPYLIIKAALADAQNQYNSASTSGDIKLAKIRPYLQDFTASWLKKGNYILYNTQAVTDQLQACYDLDIHEFILWDPSNKYAYEAINNIVKETSNSGDEIIFNSGD